MPSADVPSLPPWLTRNYDYAQGFRGIGRGLAQGYENAAVQQQVQARQQALQEQAQEAAMRRQGIAGYQKTFQQLVAQGVTPEDASIKAYVQHAPLLDPKNFGRNVDAAGMVEVRRLGNQLKDATDRLKVDATLQALADKRDQFAQKEKRVRELFEEGLKSKEGMFDAGLIEKRAEETGRDTRAAAAETGRNQRSAATLNARMQAAIEKDKVLEGLNDQLSTAQSDVRAFASETPSLLGKTGVAGRTKAAIAADLAKAKKDVADIQRQINKRQSELRSRLKATPEGEEPADTPEDSAPEANDPLGIRGLLK